MKAQTIIAFFGMLCIAAVNSQGGKQKMNFCQGLLLLSSGDMPLPNGVTADEVNQALELIKTYNKDYIASRKDYTKLFTDLKNICDFVDQGDDDKPPPVKSLINHCTRLTSTGTTLTKNQALATYNILSACSA
jgi:hypothetical protein